MSEGGVFYRRNLPHIHPKDGMFFITFRLAGSLPQRVLKALREEKESRIKALEKRLSGKELFREKYRLESLFFGKYDGLLDRASEGPQWLKEIHLARIVVDKIHDLDGKRYRLISYCVMSNHVHLLIDTMGHDEIAVTNVSGKTLNYPVTDCLRLLKGSTARWCNLELKRNGAFWHKESYDHYVRDEEELARIIQYVLNNPVKAHLVKDWQEWKLSYLNESFST